MVTAEAILMQDDSIVVFIFVYICKSIVCFIYMNLFFDVFLEWVGNVVFYVFVSAYFYM